MSTLDEICAGNWFPTLSTLENALPTLTDPNSFHSAEVADAELHTHRPGYLETEASHDFLPISEVDGPDRSRFVFSPLPSLFSLASPTIMMSPVTHTYPLPVKSASKVDFAITGVGAMRGRFENENPNTASHLSEHHDKRAQVEDRHVNILHPIPKVTSTRVEALEKLPLQRFRLNGTRWPVHASKLSYMDSDNSFKQLHLVQPLSERVEEIADDRTTIHSPAADVPEIGFDHMLISSGYRLMPELQHRKENEAPRPNFQPVSSVWPAVSTTTSTESSTNHWNGITDINAFFTQDLEEEPAQAESVLVELSRAMRSPKLIQTHLNTSRSTEMEVDAEPEPASRKILHPSTSFITASLGHEIGLKTKANTKTEVASQELSTGSEKHFVSDELPSVPLAPEITAKPLSTENEVPFFAVKPDKTAAEKWGQLRAQTPLGPFVSLSHHSQISVDHLSTVEIPVWGEDDKQSSDTWNSPSVPFELGRGTSFSGSDPSFSYIITDHAEDALQERIENRVNSFSSISTSSSSWCSTSTSETIPVSIYEDLNRPSIPRPPPKKSRKRAVKYGRMKKGRSQSTSSNSLTNAENRLRPSLSDSGFERKRPSAATSLQSHSTDHLLEQESQTSRTYFDSIKLKASEGRSVGAEIEKTKSASQTIFSSKSASSVPSSGNLNSQMQQKVAQVEGDYDPDLIPSVPVSSYTPPPSTMHHPSKSSSSPNFKLSKARTVKNSKHAKSFSGSSTSISSLAKGQDPKLKHKVPYESSFRAHFDDSSVEGLVPAEFENGASLTLQLVPSTTECNLQVLEEGDIDSFERKAENPASAPSVIRRPLRTSNNHTSNNRLRMQKLATSSPKTKKRAGQKMIIGSPPLAATAGRTLKLVPHLSPPITNGTLSQGKVVSFPKKRGRPRTGRSLDVYYEVIYSQPDIPTIVIHTPSQVRASCPTQANQERNASFFAPASSSSRINVRSEVPLLVYTNLEVTMQRQSSMVCGGVGRSSLRTGTGSKVLISLYGTHEILEQLSKSPVFFFAKSITPEMLGDLRKVLLPCRAPAAGSSVSSRIKVIDPEDDAEKGKETEKDQVAVSASSLLAFVAKLPDACPDLEFTFTDGRGYFGYNGVPELEKVDPGSRYYHNSPRPTWKLTYTARIFSINSTVANFKGKKRDLKLAISVVQYPLPYSECLPSMPIVSLDPPMPHAKVPIKQERNLTPTPPPIASSSNDGQRDLSQPMSSPSKHAADAKSKTGQAPKMGAMFPTTFDSPPPILAEITSLHAGSIVDGSTFFGLHTQKGSHKKHPSRYASSFGVTHVLNSAASIYRRKKTFSVSESAKRTEKIVKKTLAKHASASSHDSVVMRAETPALSLNPGETLVKQTDPLVSPRRNKDNVSDVTWKRQLEMKRVTRSNAPLFDPSPFLGSKTSSEFFWNANSSVHRPEMLSKKLVIRIPVEAVKSYPSPGLLPSTSKPHHAPSIPLEEADFV